MQQTPGSFVEVEILFPYFPLSDNATYRPLTEIGTSIAYHEKQAGLIFRDKQW